MVLSAAMVRAIRLALLLVPLTIGCGDKKSDSETEKQPPGPEPTEQAIKELNALVGKLPQTNVKRTPMKPTPQADKDPRAATYYKTAADRALAAMTGDVTADKVLSYVDRWTAAPEEIRGVGAGNPAREAATYIATGAGAATGASPLETGADSKIYVDAGVASIASGLEDAANGQSVPAAWKLLGTARYGQDLARGTTIDRVDDAVSLIRPALAGLRDVVTNADPKKLPDDKVGEILAACQRVASTHQSYAEILASDLRRRIGALGDAPELATVSKLKAHAEVIGELAASQAKAAGKQELLARRGKEVWGDEVDPSLDVDRYGRWLLAGADIDGTCITIALELDRRGRKKNALAPDLAALTPKPLAEPILDPFSGRPWEYVDDGFGGRLLRTMPIHMGDKTATVEMRIAKRGK